ncbi:hypothetical protein MSG28_006368 [Choristoneura fumiferana]|uniref:Uncharacterized protein n=1 Tax=Choristoneura fumiferana TaxID=7141 RepID=A0ACC0JER9_CHOFU|nr:hypothetical protein MSG28_006368 [Choristoneura fumiferana]
MQVRSQNSLRSAKSSSHTVTNREEIYLPPLDVLTVRIKSLKVTNEDFRRHSLKVTFFDQLLISTAIIPVRARDRIEDQTIAQGTMSYDPSDYEKMCLFADHPLVVRVQPTKMVESSGSDSYVPIESSKISMEPSSSTKSEEQSSSISSIVEISCCNVDILPLFRDVDKKRIKKRMQPLLEPTTLQCHSWDTLPLITIELQVTRNPQSVEHHKILKNANFMKVTLVAAYNVLTPYDEEYNYTAATKSPVSSENVSIYVFSRGAASLFSVHCLCYNLPVSVIWGSFHRHLILKDGDRQLWKHLRQYNWPLEFHIYGETGGYSFMGFMDLFRLLYPGDLAGVELVNLWEGRVANFNGINYLETTVRLAVPLQWVNAEQMMEKCGCDLLLTANAKEPDLPFGVASTPKPKGTTSTPTSESTEVASLPRPSGSDGNCAFIIVEVQLFRPLIKPSIPPFIDQPEIRQMLIEMEDRVVKPKCTGRGQLARDWQATVRSAANSLRRVPYYGMTEFCAFNRQLSETRTRVELTTSCWLDAAVYVNNNFVVQDYLQTDDTFEEMVMMAHACLLKETCLTLIGSENLEQNPTLRAARHARQLQDTHHAMDLYLQLVAESSNNANSWRELSTCMRDIDGDLADVCIDKAVMLDPRHPLTLLAKGSMLYEEDLNASELFFKALLSLYPLWTTGWVIASAFYIEKQEFHMADQIMTYLRKTLSEGLAQDLAPTRVWERELGDWWDHTPLLPGMSRYFDAADLLLRLRAMSLAEVCLGRALSEGGESAAYAHLVALSCRLRGDTENALCHLQRSLESLGEISYLRSLEAECLHKQGDRAGALTSFEKSGNYASAYSILISLPCRDAQRTRSVLVDLLRRQPSARAWMALADDWIMRQEQAASGGEAGDGAAEAEVGMTGCAIACAVQALRQTTYLADGTYICMLRHHRWDRQCARAWALLARLVRPRARRDHCRDMAAACGYEWSPQQLDSLATSRQSPCFEVGKALKECHCDLCDTIKF